MARSTIPKTDLSLAERLQFRAARALDLVSPALQLKLADSGLETEVDGQQLDPGLALVLTIAERQGLGSLTHGVADAPAMRKLATEAGRVGARPRTEVGAVRELRVPGAEGELRARHYAPVDAGTGPAPLLVYAHGGGYVLGDLESHDEACRIFCRSGGLHVVSVEYRLAPEHPFPAGVHDVAASIRWARQNAESLGADPRRVGLGGDSAGANLTIGACRVLADEPEAQPDLQVLIYPGIEVEGDSESRRMFAEGYFLTRADIETFRELYVPEDADPEDPLLVPSRAKSFEDQPPAIVVTAGFDPLRDEGEAYARQLREAGVDVVAWREPSLIHGFINFTNVNRASRDATIALAGSIRTALG